METSATAYSSCLVDRSTAQIRLVHLQPRASSDHIQCTLHLGDLNDDRCIYEALSYEWGDAQRPRSSIKLDGKDFFVRENLYWALSYLRQDIGHRTIWIDAICINQENENERNHQAEQTANFLDHFYGGTVDRISGGDSVRPAPFWKAYSAQEKRIPDCTLECRFLLQLCRRTYWTRLWIIQELVLARRIFLCFGNHRIPWDHVEAFFQSLPLLNIPVSSSAWVELKRFDIKRPKGTESSSQFLSKDRRIYQMAVHTVRMLYETTVAKILRQRKYISLQGLTLLDLFQTYREASCADVRDKLFGVHSMSRSCCQRGLTVDYSRSPAELCNLLLQHHIQLHSTNVYRLAIAALQTFGTENTLWQYSLSSDVYNTQLAEELMENREPVLIGLNCRIVGSWTWVHRHDSIKNTARQVRIRCVPRNYERTSFDRHSLWELHEIELNFCGGAITSEICFFDENFTEAEDSRNGNTEVMALLRIFWFEYLIVRLDGRIVVPIARILDQRALFNSLQLSVTETVLLDCSGFEALCKLSFGFCHLVPAKSYIESGNLLHTARLSSARNSPDSQKTTALFAGLQDLPATPLNTGGSLQPSIYPRNRRNKRGQPSRPLRRDD
ncbi:hypothetical protein G7Y89_g13661 [Cudoniella acicularis]|uniref:Heterokaryon incompatibility domain-containing protein n=1 Tax=Cudoniella acicularis TaxID=354080 RepID=A0A8H4VY11_9HELO|nr:hypothetical protein G7Y89_g13661 [Cudoniella acicularis]